MIEADSLQSKLLWSLKWVGQLLTIFNVACDSFTVWVLVYTCFSAWKSWGSQSQENYDRSLQLQLFNWTLIMSTSYLTMHGKENIYMIIVNNECLFRISSRCMRLLWVVSEKKILKNQWKCFNQIVMILGLKIRCFLLVFCFFSVVFFLGGGGGFALTKRWKGFNQFVMIVGLKRCFFVLTENRPQDFLHWGQACRTLDHKICTWVTFTSGKKSNFREFPLVGNFIQRFICTEGSCWLTGKGKNCEREHFNWVEGQFFGKWEIFLSRFWIMLLCDIWSEHKCFFFRQKKVKKKQRNILTILSRL